MIDANTLRRLAAVEMPPEALRQVLSIFADMHEIMSAKEGVRLEKQRARKARSRDRNVTVTGQERDGHTNVTGQERDQIPSPYPPPKDNITQTPHPPTPGSPHERAKRAVRLSPSAEPTASMVSHAKSKGMTDQLISSEFARMRDWSLSHKNGAKLDWEAAWRNWVRDFRPTGPGPPGGISRQPTTRADALADIQREAHRKILDERTLYADPTLDLSIAADP